MLRRPKRRIPPPQQVIYDDFQPPAEWVQEPSNYILLIHLPGFKMEDLSVASDEAGKIIIRGRRQVGDAKFTGFERSYDAPRDSNLGEISWQLRDAFLALTIPKAVVVEPGKSVKPSEEKIKEPVRMTEDPIMAAEEREDAVGQLSPEGVGGEGQPEGVGAAMNGLDQGRTMKEPKMAVEERKEAAARNKIEREAISRIRDEDEATTTSNGLNEGPTMKEREVAMKEITEEPKMEKKIENGTKEREKDLTVKKEAMVKEDEKMIEEPTERNLGSVERKKEDTMQVSKQENFPEKNEESEEEEVPSKQWHGHEELQEKPMEKDRGKRRRLWHEEDKSWLDWFDGEFIDGVLRKFQRNRKLIAIALLAFSTGLYISQKLRKRG